VENYYDRYESLGKWNGDAYAWTYQYPNYDPNHPDPTDPEYGCCYTQLHMRLYSAAPAGSPCGGTPDCATEVNGDCIIDNVELQALLDAWAKSTGQPGFDARVDYDESGLIDNIDLQALLDTWANDCRP
jgi:hypothetical protein